VAKIIERSLTTIYTKGTLMGDFVVGDMSSYIMAIKVKSDVASDIALFNKSTKLARYIPVSQHP
jgi:DNA mismatch repair ATPase MutS